MNSFFPSLHWTNLLIIPGLLIGYTVHELGHALTAYFLGDTSQVEQGKITLNPLAHLSWFGALSFLLFGVGWPKPMQANPHHFKRRYLDLFLVAVSGPLASLTLALSGLLLTLSVAATVVYVSGSPTDRVLAFLFPASSQLPHSLDLQAWTMALTGKIVSVSFWLSFISLLPLPGLDGFAAIASLLALARDRQRRHAAQLAAAPAFTRPLTWQDQQHRRNSAAEIHFKIGVQFHLEQKYEDAIARYRQAVANDKNFGPAYINMGLAYLARGRRKEAIQALRGAIEHADDQKTQTQAWQQLHQLSEVSPVDEAAAQQSLSEMGASPWTDTQPRPNWLALGLGGGVIVLAALGLYGYLLSRLIQLLQP
ncbi:MAG: tetratricopeptide repeat protein [Chloroflexota bacterium]